MSLASFCGTLADSADPDQIPHNAVCNQDLHCLLTECSIKILNNGNGFVLLVMVGMTYRLKWAKFISTCALAQVHLGLY